MKIMNKSIARRLALAVKERRLGAAIKRRIKKYLRNFLMAVPSGRWLLQKRRQWLAARAIGSVAAPPPVIMDSADTLRYFSILNQEIHTKGNDAHRN
jgi:hypothetical protein